MNKFQAITRIMSVILFLNCRNIPWNFMQYLVVLCFMSVSMYHVQSVRLATEWLEILSLPPNDKISNHSVANPIYAEFELQYKIWVMMYNNIQIS